MTASRLHADPDSVKPRLRHAVGPEMIRNYTQRVAMLPKSLIVLVTEPFADCRFIAAFNRTGQWRKTTTPLRDQRITVPLQFGIVLPTEAYGSVRRVVRVTIAAVQRT